MGIKGLAKLLSDEAPDVSNKIVNCGSNDNIYIYIYIYINSVAFCGCLIRYIM